jgi:Spy/CpxP family protein refolding chaperone
MVARFLSRVVPSLALTFALPALGCGGSVASEPAVAAESATERAPVAQSAHGLVRLAGEALGDVPLTAAQRTQIEQLATEAEARHAAAHAARTDLNLALAAQIQTGQIDRAALQPKLDALAAALAKAQPGDRAGFERLHALLSADQRTTFIDALEARVAAQRENAYAKHPLKQWAEDLNVTDEQREQIKTALHGRFHAHAQASTEASPWEGATQRGAKVFSAFKQDRFVMDEVVPPRDVAQGVAKIAEHAIGLAEAVLPSLTPEQRALAAQKIRDKASSVDAPGAPF